MKRNKSKTALSPSVYENVAGNLVIGTLILSIGAFCFAPLTNAQETSGNAEKIYRCAETEAQGVSLMFNVYWGTEILPSILDTLKKYEAKATFFIGGCWADDNVNVLKKIFADGHEIGNHGYFHKDHAKLSLEQNRKEISDCNAFIKLVIGVSPILFAPPSGAYATDMLTACRELHMKTILWSKDTIDWRDKNPSLIYTRATKNIKNGDFVLMHPMQETSDALEDILKYYREHGLKCVTVSENLQL